MQSKFPSQRLSTTKGASHFERLCAEIEKEARQWDLISKVVVLIALLFIFVGLFMLLIFQNVTVGLITCATGILIKIVNFLVYRPTENSVNRRQQVLEMMDKRDSADLAVQLALSTKGATRERLIEAIVQALLEPSPPLHESTLAAPEPPDKDDDTLNSSDDD